MSPVFVVILSILGILFLAFCAYSYWSSFKYFDELVGDLHDRYITDEKVLTVCAVIMTAFAPVVVFCIWFQMLAGWVVELFMTFLEALLLDDDERQRCSTRRLHAYRRQNTFRL